MARLPGTPLRHTPLGVTDTVDGTNSPPGAMLALSNWVPAPSTFGVWVPRPGAVAIADFEAAGFASPGFISGELVVGDIAYGTIATSRNAGHDEPYCFNLDTGEAIPVAGVTADNTPESPPSSGDWTPPILAQVGSRIVVCHPGFPGGSIKFGWFDISGFTETVLANTQGSLNTGYILTGNPSILGVQPGMTITGTNIPAGATVVSTGTFTLTTTGATNSNGHLTGLATTAGVAVGQTVTGVGIPAGAVVTVLVSPSAVDISPIATASATVAITFGGTTITMSEYATGAANSLSVVIAGGTAPIAYPITADTVLGSAVLTGYPDLAVVRKGMLIKGPGIPAGTTVASTGSFSLVTDGDTHAGSTTLDNITSTAGVTVGQRIAGIGISYGTTVAALVSATEITLSQPAVSTASSNNILFTGTSITMSAVATITANAVDLTLVGVPLWGAGDTDRNNLPSVPLAVAQLNGRSYFVCGVFGIPFSDSGFACRMSNATVVQVLTTNDGLPVTMIAPLMLSTLLGGIVQSLIAFQGAVKMQQISGDLTTGNLAMNALPVGTGTLAPLSCAPCSKGLAFVSPHGLRIVGFDGTVSDTIGDAGQGITVPIIFAAVQSRICAAYNDDTIRISTQNTAVDDSPMQEWWYDLTRKVWSGPHTSAASLIQPFRNNFAMTFAVGGGEKIYRSDAHPGPGSVYTELNLPMFLLFATSLLPDSGDVRMIKVVEMLLAAKIPYPEPLVAYAVSDRGEELDLPVPQAIFNQAIFGGGARYGQGGVLIAADPPGALYGSAIFGVDVFGPRPSTFRQRRVQWDKPLVFKQASIQITGLAADGLMIGNLYMNYQHLNYPVVEEAA